MATNDASTPIHDAIKRARFEKRRAIWYPDLISVCCARCQEETIGPWIPVGYGVFLCEDCWAVTDEPPSGRAAE